MLPKLPGRSTSPARGEQEMGNEPQPPRRELGARMDGLEWPPWARVATLGSCGHFGLVWPLRVRVAASGLYGHFGLMWPLWAHGHIGLLWPHRVRVATLGSCGHFRLLWPFWTLGATLRPWPPRARSTGAAPSTPTPAPRPQHPSCSWHPLPPTFAVPPCPLCPGLFCPSACCQQI